MAGLSVPTVALAQLDVHELLDELRSREPLRKAAALRLARKRRPEEALPLILRIAKLDTSISIRSVAVETLGYYRNKTISAMLREYVKHDEVDIRRAALAAAGRRRESFAFEKLVEAFADSDCRRHALLGLSLLRDPRAFPLLAKHLKSGSASRDIWAFEYTLQGLIVPRQSRGLDLLFQGLDGRWGYAAIVERVLASASRGGVSKRARQLLAIKDGGAAKDAITCRYVRLLGTSGTEEDVSVLREIVRKAKGRGEGCSSHRT